MDYIRTVNRKHESSKALSLDLELATGGATLKSSGRWLQSWAA